MKKQRIAVLFIFAMLLTMTGCASANTVSMRDANRMEDRMEAAAGTGLTQEQAESIALQHVGLAADQTDRLRTEYEIDDGVAQYDVSFCEGDWEYEFEIDAGTGTILSYEKEHRYD